MLSPTEQHAWRTFVRLHQKLTGRRRRTRRLRRHHTSRPQTIEAAAPHHVATVRRLVIDTLTPDELTTLARLSNRILEQLDNPPR